MFALSFIASALAAASVVYAQTSSSAAPTPTQWNITVGASSVNAAIGDTVYFNFTQGNHTVIQSTFPSPCIWIDETNVTVNGFTTGFRDAGNFTTITNFILPITDNSTIWFFDWNTCAIGSSWQTLAGFVVCATVKSAGSSANSIDAAQR
ncbi:uncharacterized protein B0H18DRAFT_1064252 [Fomitopsis serialis]|uniref:uncharacterized protein n=1 Tax=Fomitopsis serialis TaxID=139415 RepID=UPI0020079721|nr:uncharacterized protein B0H18DRAFT_1064252 [Neoantrodia serialis]KAH9911194.1 hypothetical protein B0H18DRAFT_1064252 [Neoantrodia serialis]